MSLVFVSSDRSQEAFDGYLGVHWNVVPYDDEPQRTALKKYFQVCAQPEAEPLGIDRKAGIPTLIIIDSNTRQVLTRDGADDLETHKEKAIEHWMGLLAKSS